MLLSAFAVPVANPHVKSAANASEAFPETVRRRAFKLLLLVFRTPSRVLLAFAPLLLKCPGGIQS